MTKQMVMIQTLLLHCKHQKRNVIKVKAGLPWIVHTADKTRRSCLVRVGGVNRIDDKSRLSVTEISKLFCPVSIYGEDY